MVVISIHAHPEEGDVSVPVRYSSFLNFYPRPPRGGRPEKAWKIKQYRQISIHALREEGDVFRLLRLLKTSLFLSTPSARRATSNGRKIWASTKFLSTPSARRATRFKRRQDVKLTIFLSTPSARRATRAQRRLYRSKGEQFLSTPSARRATWVTRRH